MTENKAIKRVLTTLLVFTILNALLCITSVTTHNEALNIQYIGLLCIAVWFGIWVYFINENED